MTHGKVAELTELEGVALAVIARSGPMTAYGVKEVLAGSPSRFWSGSAGAVYPLMKRLAERGLLTPSGTATGQRAATTYTVSRNGKRALKAWLADVDKAIDPGIDPLRFRLLYLSVLSDRERTKFLEDVSRRLVEAVTESPFAGGPDAFDNRNHHIWMAARQEAFEKALREL